MAEEAKGSVAETGSAEGADVSAAASVVSGVQGNLRIHVHVKDKVITVPCGHGPQTVKWLGHVAIARYDDKNCKGWLELGVPTAVVKSDESLPMDATVKSVLADGDHVSVQHSLGHES